MLLYVFRWWRGGEGKISWGCTHSCDTNAALMFSLKVSVCIVYRSEIFFVTVTSDRLMVR